MMASQICRSPALQQFFSHSAYHMYGLAPEKSLRLAYRTFYLALFDAYRDFSGFYQVTCLRGYQQ
jgi:hypothetical protein